MVIVVPRLIRASSAMVAEALSMRLLPSPLLRPLLRLHLRLLKVRTQFCVLVIHTVGQQDPNKCYGCNKFLDEEILSDRHGSARVTTTNHLIIALPCHVMM